MKLEKCKATPNTLVIPKLNVEHHITIIPTFLPPTTKSNIAVSLQDTVQHHFETCIAFGNLHTHTHTHHHASQANQGGTQLEPADSRAPETDSDVYEEEEGERCVERVGASGQQSGGSDGWAVGACEAEADDEEDEEDYI